MPYKNDSISSIVEKIDKKQFYLPAIQRKYVGGRRANYKVDGFNNERLSIWDVSILEGKKENCQCKTIFDV